METKDKNERLRPRITRRVVVLHTEAPDYAWIRCVLCEHVVEFCRTGSISYCGCCGEAYRYMGDVAVLCMSDSGFYTDDQGARIRFTKVASGNGEPEMWKDALGRAYWADRSRVRLDECSDTPENRAAAYARHKLDDDDVFDLDLIGQICCSDALLVLDGNGSDVLVPDPEAEPEPDETIEGETRVAGRDHTRRTDEYEDAL